MGYYATLLQSAAQAPDAAVGALPLLSANEQHELLYTFNETSAAYPEESCLHALFEAQVERTPAAVAVVYDNQCLTYAELNAQANQLAHFLRQRGVGVDTRVGLCVGRGVNMLVGLLGILKAGGAYVPLNPEHPKARLGQQLIAIQAPVVLTQEAYVHQIPDVGGEVICLDRDRARFTQAPETNQAPLTTPAHLV
jgi:non-ribosomal peptide synthetase component F